MIQLLLFIIILCNITVSAQQAATINGQIIYTYNKPVENITVRLAGTTSVTITGRDGEFKLLNIANGNYTIEVSESRFKAEKQNIIISNGKSIELALQLNRVENILTEVFVSAK